MKKNNAFCSICTVNYSTYAATLNDSLRKAGHNEPHYVLVVDYDKKYDSILDDFDFKVVSLTDLGIPKVNELIEKYSPFELSNVLKPFFVEWLLNNHPEINILIYLDTDTYVYSRLNNAINFLEKNKNISVALNPHLNDYLSYIKQTDYKIERIYLTHGLYNGGFYIFKNDENTHVFLKWHKKKLSKYGYSRVHDHMYVDQKILDFAPIIFSFVGIFKNRAYNVAHWNYYPGLITEKNGCFYADKNRLVFFHFSQIPEHDVTGNFLFDITKEDKNIFEKLVSAYYKDLEDNNYEKIKKIPYGYNKIYKKPSLSITDPISHKTIELESARKELELSKNKLLEIERQLSSTKEDLQNAESQVDTVFTRIFSLKKELHSAKAELNRIYTSREWKLVTNLHNLSQKIIPKGSYRRISAVSTWRVIKSPLRLVKIVRKSLKPKKRRKINSKSKKIVFIAHSYHKKTKSHLPITRYLKQFFDLEIHFDDSWQGKPFIDLSFINRSYLAVIFWQNIPPRNLLDKVKNENIIFFPMYDGVPHNFEFWEEYRELKIISFSKSLHQIITKWDLDSLYIQYFPKPQKFTPGNNNEVFFWQRIKKINISTIIKLFDHRNIKIHIHKTVDPGFVFIKPSKEEEKKYSITYSDWFKTKDDMLNLIKKKGIYIAPREYEGIGMSFLEAMTMGKAVIAADNPTMNEYIKHNKTGYLFNLSNPQKIDLSNINKIQRNTHDYITRGYKKWNVERYKIVDFIKKP